MTDHQHEHDHDHAEHSAQHEQQEDKAPNALQLQAAAQGRADVLGSNGILNMQRAVGNTAVRSSIQRSPVLVSGGGRALEEPVRQDMEARLGADFSDVRVHDDSAAHASAKSVSAHAYTVGNSIVFQRDAYAPGTPSGDRTLAHELTHVIQQRSGPVEGTPAGNGVSVSDPSDRFEREAVANADRVMSQPAPSQVAAGSVASSGGGSVQREAVIQREAEGPGESEEVEEAEPVQRQATVQREEEEPDDEA